MTEQLLVWAAKRDRVRERLDDARADGLADLHGPTSIASWGPWLLGREFASAALAQMRPRWVGHLSRR